MNRAKYLSKLPPYFLQDVVSTEQFLSYHKENLTRIENASNTHITWYTHKNPYGCWICDLILELRTLLNYLEDGSLITSKSSRPVDMTMSKKQKSRDASGSDYLSKASGMSEAEFRSEVLSRLDSIIVILNEMASGYDEEEEE